MDAELVADIARQAYDILTRPAADIPNEFTISCMCKIISRDANSLIPKLLSWTRDSLALPDAAQALLRLYSYSSFPYAGWKPTLSDTLLCAGLLVDDENSAKCIVAQCILDRAFLSSDAPIAMVNSPRGPEVGNGQDVRRALAVSICNICLDRYD